MTHFSGGFGHGFLAFSDLMALILVLAVPIIGKSHLVLWPWCLQPVWKARLECVTFISLCGCSQNIGLVLFYRDEKAATLCMFMGQSWLMFWCWHVLSVPHSPALVSACVVAGFIPPLPPSLPHRILSVLCPSLTFAWAVYFFRFRSIFSRSRSPYYR